MGVSPPVPPWRRCQNVAMHPTWQLCCPDLARIVAVTETPLSDCGLGGALGLAVGPSRVRVGAPVFDAQASAAAGELVAPVAIRAVSQDPFDTHVQ